MTIWYDVSGLYDWKGAFTGIQRVVYNLAEALRNEPDLKLFIYQQGAFSEISFDELESKLVVARAEVPERQSQNQRLTRAQLQHYTVLAAKRLVLGSPVEAPLRKAYTQLRRGYRSMKNRRPPTVQPVPFQAGDQVVVVDGNWQFPGYAQELTRTKQLVAFQLVHFVHDLVAIKNPAFANTGAKQIIGGYFAEIFGIVDLIICVSQATRRDVEWLISDLGVTRPIATHVLTSGSNVTTQGERIVTKPAIPLPKEFILAVSTIEIRKNYLLLYYAYKLAAEQKLNLPTLLIVGRKGWMSEETYALLTLDTELQDKIKVLHGISDPELEWLYEHCAFTISPAFAEGWGLTIAESFAHGKACISSNTSSMPEVGKDMAYYISPYDPAAVVAAILHYQQPAQRKAAEARIRSGYKARTWQQVATELYAVLTKQ
ncbi:MAG TPA: glycosyltransferase [Candidatus Saccharimonadales bacterium]|nr:glycosyltransferase [Candidatus Saccharimonadales bacterium]